MALTLQFILAGVLVALCACLVPLLLQLKRTAQAVEKLADSARQDLGGIARDVHQVRQRVDELADLATTSLAIPASLGEWVSLLIQKLPEVLETKMKGWPGLVVAGLKLVLNAFLRGKEKCHE
jgi:hypothetical protein